jgi:hypothetical protein
VSSHLCARSSVALGGSSFELLTNLQNNHTSDFRYLAAQQAEAATTLEKYFHTLMITIFMFLGLK